MGWRRWFAIIVGLIGVVIIIQPGTDSFSVLSFLAIVGMFGFAGRDLASRAAPATLSTNILGLTAFCRLWSLAGSSRSGKVCHFFSLTLRRPIIC